MINLWPIAVLIGVLGLAIGSFLNVVIYRVPRRESVVSPGSHCPGCGNPIKGRHNVPVLGWLALRGRCATCRMKISARYPLVEAATGVLFAATTLRVGLHAQLPAFLFLAAVAVALAMIDVDVRTVPDTLVLPSYAAGVALLTLAAFVDDEWWPLARAVLGALAVLALAAAAMASGRTRLRPDDVKLAGLLGLYLGWLSWVALLIGVGLALVAVLAERVRTRTRGRQPGVPVGSCLIAAAVLAVLVLAPLAAANGTLLIG